MTIKDHVNDEGLGEPGSTASWTLDTDLEIRHIRQSCIKDSSMILEGFGEGSIIDGGGGQGLLKGVKLCLNPYIFGWLEK